MSTICVTGRVGRDGELRTLQDGTKVLSFNVADDIGWGEKKTTQWLQCAMFGKRAEALAAFVTKGTMVEVVGTPTVDAYIKKGEATPTGTIKVRVSEVRLHGGGKPADSIVHTNAPGGARVLTQDEAADVRAHVRSSRSPDFDDDLPF